MIWSPVTAQPGSHAAKSLAVLLVEDVVELQDVVKNMLEFMGHSVTCASGGYAAITLLKLHPFDLVITDVLMPNGDGVEVMLQLRKTQPQTPVIAMSGGGVHLDAHDCLRVAKGLGADAVLLKPFRPAALLAAIDQVTRHART